jgi:hypothetical protein
MSEADPEGQAANLIFEVRRDFFGVHVPVVGETPSEANAILEADLVPGFSVPDEELRQAHILCDERMRIEQHALWAIDIHRRNRNGEVQVARLAEVMEIARSGMYAIRASTIEGLLLNQVRTQFEFYSGIARESKSLEPFDVPSQEVWPIHRVLAVFAIGEAASVLHDMLVGYMDQPQSARLRYLLYANRLHKLAVSYREETSRRELEEQAKNAARTAISESHAARRRGHGNNDLIRPHDRERIIGVAMRRKGSTDRDIVVGDLAEALTVSRSQASKLLAGEGWSGSAGRRPKKQAK